ncbi:hypothetical protein OIO90_001771 [Microbotryomycetes sp. JL221]|nr:hypothetical protein OIO90_001771 [Microbotryomycetes sp. JL221]
MDAALEEHVQTVQQAAASCQNHQDGTYNVDWTEIAHAAECIANRLTSGTFGSAQLRVELGSTTSIISSCGQLLQFEHVNSMLAKTQMLRIIGNICYENDDNRKQSDDAHFPWTILSALKSLLACDAESSTTWSLNELKFTRAAVGALLNMTLKYEPIRKQLMTTAAITVLLALIHSKPALDRKQAIYVVNEWSKGPTAGQDDIEWQQSVEMRAFIVTWTMTILDDVTEGNNAILPSTEAVETLASVIVACKDASAVVTAETAYDGWDFEDVSQRTETDLELLTNASSMLEAISIDHEEAKLALGLGLFPLQRDTNESTTLLSQLMDFVETTTVPSNWDLAGRIDSATDKAFSLIKSATIRAIVEAPNSDLVMNKLFAIGNKSWLVVRLVGWLEKDQTGREDLLICGSHMLAALARKDEHCVSLVHQYGVAVPLSKIVIEKSIQQFDRTGDGAARPGEVTQILYGTVGLLRHLAIPVANKTLLGEQGFIGPVSRLLQPKMDVVGPLQNSVVGLLKHLTAANVPNSLQVLEASTGEETTTTIITPLDLLIKLIPRTDDVRLRSEATRVLVNIVRTLFATKALATAELAAASPITPTLHSSVQSSLNVEEQLKRRGRPKIARKDVVEALSEMIRLSEKYPMLINEAVVGLTLLAGSGGAGATFVLDALLQEHAKSVSEQTDASTDASTNALLTNGNENVQQQQQQQLTTRQRSSTQTSTRTASLAISPAGDPPKSIDMLTTWLGLFASGRIVAQSPTTPSATTTTTSLTNGATALPSTSTTLSNVKPEMIGNVCALFITVLRGSEVAKVTPFKIQQVKDLLVGPLLGCLDIVKSQTDNHNNATSATVTNTHAFQLFKTIERCAEVVGVDQTSS